MYMKATMKLVGTTVEPSNTVAIGAEESVLIREVSSFEGLKCMDLRKEIKSLLERYP